MSTLVSSEVDALEWVLKELTKTERTKLAVIKSEAELKSFLKNKGITDGINYFKAVVPAIYHLQGFINKIDNEVNMNPEFLRKATASPIRQLQNVTNFSQTMKNFHSADLFIRFDLGSNKCIAIRANGSWLSPNKDIPIVPSSVVGNSKAFANVRANLNKEEESDEEEEPAQESGYKWEPTYEQALAIFESCFGFSALGSHNNGLYTIILELKASNFGGMVTPVHELKTIEGELAKLGIIRDNRKPKLEIKVLKQGQISEAVLQCSGKPLIQFKLNLLTLQILSTKSFL